MYVYIYAKALVSGYKYPVFPQREAFHPIMPIILCNWGTLDKLNGNVQTQKKYLVKSKAQIGRAA